VAKRLPPLESLRVLVACIRHGNFSHAAFELGVTPTAVSQRIRALEAELGVELFSRHGPTLTVTARAKALGQDVEQALSLIRTAVDECRGALPLLRVTCAPTFASRWLAPRLSTYNALPGADSIVLDNSQTLLPAGSFDVAIRSGHGPWANYNSEMLMADRRTPMFSAKWAPQPVTARQLLGMPLIQDAGWPEWFQLAGIPNPMPKFVATRYPNYELEAQAAVHGIGAALLSRVLFADLLDQGVLNAPFSISLDGRAGYWLLWKSELPECHFVRWVKAQFGIGEAPGA